MSSIRLASRPMSSGARCSDKYAATASSRPFSVASPRPETPSSVTSFSVTKLRPGEQMMTLASAMRMESISQDQGAPSLAASLLVRRSAVLRRGCVAASGRRRVVPDRADSSRRPGPRRGPVVQSLNVRQMKLAAAAACPASTSAGSSGYESAMRPEADEVRQPVARRHAAPTLRQPLLEVAVGGADERHSGKCRLQPRRRVDLPGNAAQRILRRLVAVDRREQRRPLHVRVVVRRAAGDADRTDAEARSACGAPSARRRAPRPCRRRRAAPNPKPPVSPGSGSPVPRGPRPERHGVEHREPDANHQARHFGADALDDLAHEAGAVLDRAAVLVRAAGGSRAARDRDSRGSA